MSFRSCFICFGWTIKKVFCPIVSSNSVHIHISKYKDMTCDDCVRDRQVCILGTFRPQNAMRSCYANHYVVFVSSRWKSSDFICWPENWTSRAAPVIGKFLKGHSATRQGYEIFWTIYFNYSRRKDCFPFDYSQPVFRTDKSLLQKNPFS